MKIFTKILTITAVVCILFSTNLSLASDNTANYLLNNAGSDSEKDWGAMALSAVGVSAPTSNDTADDCLAISRRILASYAQNESLDTLKNRLLSKYNNGNFCDGLINADIFATLAMSAADSGWDNSVTLQKIADSQNHDGSFAFKKGLSGDTDMTAAALWALGLSADFTSQKANAWQYINSNKQNDGAYATTGGLNASNIYSSAWVMIAMNKYGLDSINVKNYVLGAKNGDSWQNYMATAYATLALSGKSLPVRYIAPTNTVNPSNTATSTPITASKTTPIMKNADQSPISNKATGSSPSTKKPTVRKRAPKIITQTLPTPKTLTCRGQASSSAQVVNGVASASASASSWCE